MKYNLYIKGEFQNIKGIYTDQTYPALIICTACKQEHPKVVIITSESSRKEKDVYKCNFEMTCHSCKNDIRISVKQPREIIKRSIPDRYGDDMEVEYNLVEKDECKISEIEASGGEIKEIKKFEFDVITEDDKIFKGQVIDNKRCLSGDYGNGKIYSIINFEPEIRQIK